MNPVFFGVNVLAIIYLLRDVIGVMVSKAWAECGTGPPLCSMAVSALSGVESTPQLLE